MSARHPLLVGPLNHRKTWPKWGQTKLMYTECLLSISRQSDIRLIQWKPSNIHSYEYVCVGHRPLMPCINHEGHPAWNGRYWEMKWPNIYIYDPKWDFSWQNIPMHSYFEMDTEVSFLSPTKHHWLSLKWNKKLKVLFIHGWRVAALYVWNIAVAMWEA